MTRHSRRRPEHGGNDPWLRSLIPNLLLLRPVTISSTRAVFWTAGRAGSGRDSVSLAIRSIGCPVCSKEDLVEDFAGIDDFLSLDLDIETCPPTCP